MDGKRYVYSREMDGQKLLILCSFSEKCEKVRIPKGFDLSKATLILQNYPDADPKTLKPYEARVYRW